MLVPLKTVIPFPAWVSEPVPEMTLATVKLFVRLNTSIPLLMMLPDPRVPVVPPLPICSVPPLTVVVPA